MVDLFKAAPPPATSTANPQGYAPTTGNPPDPRSTDPTETSRRPRSTLAVSGTPQRSTENVRSTLTEQGVLTFAGPGSQVRFEEEIPPHTTPHHSDRSEDNSDTSDDDEVQVLQVVEPLHTQAPPGHRGMSALEQAAASELARDSSSIPFLTWQSDVAGIASQAREFREQVLKTESLAAFAFLRPGSAHIQILHAMGTFTDHAADEETSDKDFGFVGDKRDPFRQPTPVHIPEKAWKWTTRKVVLDSTLLEMFYAIPANKSRLYQPQSKTGEQQVSVPRFILLPPMLVAFCSTTPRTPFDLHQFVTGHVTGDITDTTIQDWQLVLDWCIVASHHEAASITTSTLALTFHPAPTHDDVFVKWLKVMLMRSFGANGAPPTNPAQPTPPVAQPEQPPPPAAQQLQFQGPIRPPHPGPNVTATTPPQQAQQTIPGPPQPPYPTQYAYPQGYPPAPPDMWAHIAANLTQGIASMAAAIAPAHTTATLADPSTNYDHGGRDYDEFQLAILKGFAHTARIEEVPQIWPMFQYTKHMDAHRDNIKRKMTDWARHAKPDQVNIDRGLYFPNTVLKDILALRFNPGGPTAEVATADLGLSILVCRPLSADGKSALRRREQLEATSKRKTLAEAELEWASTEPMVYPDDFNELHLCLGTYCALLHTLFGEKCAFFKHCYKLWMTMHSETVYDHRHLFKPMFCRQLVWAIIEYSRAYFAQRLSIDDFIGVHPDDVVFPRSNLIELEPHLRTQTPVVRSSFPDKWATATATAPHNAGRGGATVLPSVVGGTNSGATVVSGVTTGSTRRTQASQRPQIQIRQTNVHPAIKTSMEPYIKKMQSVKLIQMLNHVNLTVDDLPTLPAGVSGTNGICFNYILGSCPNPSCARIDGHVAATDIPDDFATELLQKLRPAITEFMTNGAPRRPKRRRRE